MNPTKYEIFLKAVESKSFTRTAEYFQYTQSAISQTIKSLEAELGVTLFHRTHDGLVLSAEGECLYAPIQEIVYKQHALEDIVFQIHDTQSGTVRLGAYHSISCHWLPDCICAFQKIYPNIQFELYQEDDIHLLDLLNKGIVDLLIVSDPHKKAYDYEPIFEDPFILLLPNDHNYAKNTTLSLKELNGQSFIYIEKGYRQYIHKMFHDANIRPTLKYNMIEDNAVISMVEHGFGIGIMPQLVTQRTPYHVSIIQPIEKVSREIGLLTRHNDYGSWAIRKFKKFAKNFSL
jgi:DNA-binding transcriptional LysR family regulator